MKIKSKFRAIFLTMVIIASSLAGCASANKEAKEPSATPTQTAEKSEASNTTDESTNEEAASQVISEEAATLRLYGPGLFTTVGENGSTDIVTGVSKPGYKVVIDRWKEFYPNVELQIETIPWDNWRAATQTAALSGDVDVLLHGSSIVPVCEPIVSYLEKEPEVREAVGMMAMRKNVELAPLSEYIPYGLTITVNPVMVVIDKEIFEHYGVELPNYESWTMQDIVDLAKKTTGTDPVTGKQTYGMSMIAANSTNKNYIWSSRAFNNAIFEWGETLGTTKVNFNNDLTRKTLNYLTELVSFASPDYAEGLDMAVAYTADNNLAMFIIEDAYSAYNTIKAAGLENKYMFAALPKIEAGEFAGITSSHMGDWNMAICNNSKQKDLAWAFIKFMVTDEVVQQWLLDTYSIPANKAASSRLSEFMPDDYANSISYVVRTSPLEFSASANNCYDSGNFGTFANDLTTVINEMAQGNMDVEAAIQFVQKNVDDYLGTLK